MKDARCDDNGAHAPLERNLCVAVETIIKSISLRISETRKPFAIVHPPVRHTVCLTEFRKLGIALVR